MSDLGQEAAFRSIYDRYYDDLWRYGARRLPLGDVPSLLSDVFLVVWQRLSDGPPEPDTRPWVYTVARHCLGNRARAERRRVRPAERIGRSVSSAEVPDSGPEIHGALARLPEHDQELLRLIYWDGLSHEHIGAVLGITANAVAIRAHRARQQMRVLLAERRKVKGQDGHESKVLEVNDQ